MKEMSRANARQIDFHGNLEECVNTLLKFQNRGESVVLDFNGHQFYSCDVTMDSAYLEVCGKTKAEFEEWKKNWKENYRKKQEEEIAKAESQIPDLIQKGKEFIYPEKLEEWEKKLKNYGIDSDTALYSLELMEKLESGASIEEVKEIFYSQNHSGASEQSVRNVMFQFAKRGPEFYESIVKELSDEDKKAIANKKKENAELAELHKDDSIKEVSVERRKEEQEITDSYTEKKQLTSEITDIEQQLQFLKAKESDLKKESYKDHSQLNGLEEK